MKITRYRPAFFSGFPDEAVEDWDGKIESVPWLQPLKPGERYEISENGPTQTCLMHITDGGAEWWIQGMIMGGKPDLPEWDGKVALELRRKAGKG